MSKTATTQSFSLQGIGIGGPDAEAFLQAQLTVDIGAIAQRILTPAAWCSPDGRAAIVVRIARRGEGFIALAPVSLTEDFIKRVQMYSIGRDVRLDSPMPVIAADPAGNDVLVPTGGSGAEDCALALGGNTSQAPAPLPGDRVLAEIDQRMPWLFPATAGRFLPQMLGLDTLGGLSYAKGCFPGQEVIARVHYRGRVTRRTMRFELEGEAVPEPGTELEIGGRGATILYAAAQPGSGVRGLVVVAAGCSDSAAFDLDGRAGRLA